MLKNASKSLTHYVRMYRWQTWHGLVLLVLCFSFLFGVRQFVNRQVTGDEPHYLLMTQSLLRDRDLNLYNNFQQKDYLPYYPFGLSPKGQVKDSQLAPDSTKWYSIHSVGIPYLLAPAFGLAGMQGAIFMMVIFATMVIWLTYLWVLEITRHRRAAIATSFILATSYFFSTLAGYFYPDMLMPLLTLGALLILHKKPTEPRYQILFGFLLGLLLLIHFKSLILVAPLSVAMLYKIWKLKHRLPWFVLPGIVPFLVYFVWSTYAWFGILNPAGIYQDLNIVGTISPPGIFTALLLDSRRGLFVYNPIFVLLIVGLSLWYRQARESLFITIMVMAPYLIVLCTFWGWFGGDAPAGRYVMDVLPLFMPALGFALLVAKDNWQKGIVGVLLGLTLLMTVLQTSLKTGYITYLTNDRTQVFVWIGERTGIAFDRLFPTFSISAHAVYPGTWAKAGIWVLLCVVLFMYGLSIARPQRRKR